LRVLFITHKKEKNPSQPQKTWEHSPCLKGTKQGEKKALSKAVCERGGSVENSGVKEKPSNAWNSHGNGGGQDVRGKGEDLDVLKKEEDCIQDFIFLSGGRGGVRSQSGGEGTV